MSVISTTSTRSGCAYFQIVGGELFRWQPVGMNSSRSVRGTGRRRTGFWQLFRQFTSNVSDHHTLLAAAGVAYFFALALVPAVVAVVSIYGLVAEPYEVADQLEPRTSALPRRSPCRCQCMSQNLFGIIIKFPPCVFFFSFFFFFHIFFFFFF